MKISVLLPYKENYSPLYAGAVSLFINETNKYSKFKKNITVFGSTNFKVVFKDKYVNIKTSKKYFSSLNKEYVSNFIKIEEQNKSHIIEVHNRPIYLNYLSKKLTNRNYILYFHNDPLSMNGSKTPSDRIFLLKNCYKIIFNSNWSKKRFLENINSDLVNSEKLLVINQSTSKNFVDIKNKRKIITFVGKLNHSKGYDLFGKAIVRILNKYHDWKSYVIGDEPRDKIEFDHENLIKLGFQKHSKVINLYKKTSIAVICSRWEEPFGRTSLEASANGCAVIISNRGGLPETVTNGIILKKLTVNEIYDKIEYLINNFKERRNFQNLSYKNFYLSHQFVSKKIDDVRYNLSKIPRPSLIYKNKKLRILHVTNFNDRHNGRLFFNTGRRINNGFIRLGHSVLEFSDRDILSRNKNYRDLTGSKFLNDKLIKTCYHFNPDLIVLGHADMISVDVLSSLKEEYSNLKIAQWFLDPLNYKGPDFEKNKKRILNKLDVIDANFLTTSPDVLKFLNKTNSYFIPNPCDESIDTLCNYENHCSNDVFFALSHGVHRGKLKNSSKDNREKFIKNLINECNNVRFDIYGMNDVQPIWADQYFKIISNSKMGLNLSRGEPIKYYSSDRLTQIIGNGLVTLIDEKTKYTDFFTDKEMVFYSDISDLSEKISRISKDEKLRKLIGKNGKEKYLRYFNSNLVAEFILHKTLNITSKKRFIWNNN